MAEFYPQMTQIYSLNQLGVNMTLFRVDQPPRDRRLRVGGWMVKGDGLRAEGPCAISRGAIQSL